MPLRTRHGKMSAQQRDEQKRERVKRVIFKELEDSAESFDGSKAPPTLGRIQKLLNSIQGDKSIALMANSYGNTLLHIAVRGALHAAQSNTENDGKQQLRKLRQQARYHEIVHFFVENFPEALSMLNRHGQTPLHMAAVGGDWGHHHRSMTASHVSLVQRMIEKYPEALFFRTATEKLQTPLHYAIAYQRAPHGVVELLIHSAPETIAIPDAHGQTPLCHLVQLPRYIPFHWKSYTENFSKFDLLRQMIKLNPRALTIVDTDRATVIQIAVFQHFPLATLQSMVEACPVACLLPTSQCVRSSSSPREHRLSYNLVRLHLHALVRLKGDLLVREGYLEYPELLLYLHATTRDMLALFLEVVFGSSAKMLSFRPVARESMKEILQKAASSSAKSFENVQSVFLHDCDYKTQERIMKAILTNEQVQAVLLQSEYQNLIIGLKRMNEAGRRRDATTSSSILGVLQSVNVGMDSGSLDCLYWCIRENPILCAASV